MGYAVSDTDPGELADRIELAVSRYTELSANCIRLVRKFSWDSIAEQYQELYQGAARPEK